MWQGEIDAADIKERIRCNFKDERLILTCKVKGS